MTRDAADHRRTSRAAAVTLSLLECRPRTVDALHRFVTHALGLRAPRLAILPHASAPFDYLVASYFGDRDLEAHPLDRSPRSDPPHPIAPAYDQPRESIAELPAGDLLVWAARGSGKTTLGAAATMLDMLFKPGVQVRVLGGSLEQSRRMYEALRRMCEIPWIHDALAQQPTQRRIELLNGSAVELLSQSHRSVRGVRVHKLRCDEVDEFKRDVWDAAQLVTRSQRLGPWLVRGRVDALSTMHRPFGLMHDLAQQANTRSPNQPHTQPPARDPDHQPHAGMRLFRWSAFDVVETCPSTRSCDGCTLWDDCRGRARDGQGFVRVDDLIRQRSRCSNTTWASEMLCRQPQRSDAVYPQFDARPGGRHVREQNIQPTTQNQHNPLTIPPRDNPPDNPTHLLLAGLDFGIRSPFAWLWALVPHARNTPEVHTTSSSLAPAQIHAGDHPIDRPLHIIAEYIEADRTLDEHLKALRAFAENRSLPTPAWVGVDPAGAARNGQTGYSDIDQLRRAGYRVRWRRASIREGVDRIRRRLDRNTLTIDPACRKLIKALSQYHFDPDRPQREEPVKDGPDHAADALRYLITNFELGAGPIAKRRY